MKNLKKLFSLCLVLALSLGTAALAAPVPDATIDTSRTGSLDIYKYDFTNAAKDGVWDSSYVSTGVYDQTVNDTQGGTVPAGDTDNTSDLGNGEQSYGYAIKGVEFTYLRVADICQFTESSADGSTSNHVEVLYGIDKANGADLLAAIGLADGAGRYENADNSDKLDLGNYYYQSDVLIDALRTSLEANAATIKNALENYVKVGGGTALPLTDSYGHTSTDGLPLFSIPTHQFLFYPGQCNPRDFQDALQVEEAEFALIRYPERGTCLYRCGNERYLLQVIAPAYKAALFGTGGGR